MYVHLQTSSFIITTLAYGDENIVIRLIWNVESPGRIALRTDANGFEDSAGSQLLHHPPGVVSQKTSQQRLQSKSQVNTEWISSKTISSALTRMGAFHRWA